MLPGVRRPLRRLLASGLAIVLVASNQAAGTRPTQAGEFDAPNLIFAAELAESGVPVDHLILIFDEIIDPDSIPEASEFTITFEPSGPTVAGMGELERLYSGFGSPDFLSAAGLSFLKLTLPVAVTTADDLRLDYTPGTNRIRDLALNEMPPLVDFQDVAILDPDDVVSGSMTFAGGVIDGDHGADTVLLFYNRPIDPTSLPATTDFSVVITDAATSTATTVTPTAISLFRPDVNVGMLDLTLPVTVARGDQVVLDYTPDPTPGAPRIRNVDSGGESDPIIDALISVLLPTTSTSASVAAGGTVSTVVGGPTVTDPVATSVTSPVEGTVSISEGTSTDPAPPAFSFFGQQVEIDAPAAPDAQHPLVLRFDIDASLVPTGQDHTTIQVFRDGVLVAACTGAAGEAVPSPCVSQRAQIGDGDLSITVLTVEASTWNLGIRVPFAFGGFEPPVDGEVANRTKAGAAVPVKFNLGGDRGLDIFAAGSPSVRLMSCASLDDGDDVEETVMAGQSSLRYDAATDTYTYVWKTSAAWEDSCRRLVLDFADGSQQTAVFDFRR